MQLGRRFRLFLGISAVCGAGLAATWTAARVRAADAPSVDPGRVVAIRHIMSGIHAPHCGAIGKLIKDAGPKDEKAWAELAMHAALLNESGHLLVQNNRCPDAVWADAAAKLREGSAGVFAAAGRKELKAAQESFTTVTAACASCHAKHKVAAPAVANAAAAPKAPASAPAAAQAQVIAPPRVAVVRHIMAGINGPSCSTLGDALKADGPREDRSWQDVVRLASLLNEAGFLLMENNRCPDDVWKDACTALRENAAKVAHAGGIKNLEDARTGFKAMTGACGDCHAVHKKPPT